MGRLKKFDYATLIENTLIANPEGLSLDELLDLANCEVDRSTLFRHLTRFIDQKKVERTGKARATRYRWHGTPAADDAAPRIPAAPVAPEAGAAVAQSAQTEQAEPAAASPPAGAQPAAGPAPAETPEHLAAINKAVRAIVREWKRYDRINLHIYLSLLVAPEHRDRLAAAVERELRGLHEGNLGRFGLTPEDLRGFAPPQRQARAE